MGTRGLDTWGVSEHQGLSQGSFLTSTLNEYSIESQQAGFLSRCLLNPSRCQSVLNVGSRCMQRRRSWLGAINGILDVSSVPCVTRCLTAPVVTRGTMPCFVRLVMVGDTDQRVTDLEEGLELLIWTLEFSLETQSSRTTSPPWTPTF